MKYLSTSSIVAAYKNNAQSTKNKFWGLLAVLYSIDQKVLPCVSYQFNQHVVGYALDEFFLLDGKEKTYPTTQSFSSVIFSTHWIEVVKKEMLSGKPNIYDIIVWCYKDEAFDDNTTTEDLLSRFINDFSLSDEFVTSVFSLTERDYIVFGDKLSLDKEILIALELDSYNGSITAENTTIVSLPHELSRAPFFQTLYSSQSILAGLIITNFDFDEYYLNTSNSFSKTSASLPPLDLPHQQIFYGAPGTGKSHTINTDTKGRKTFRTTFHPDSDYSTFVGAYKPVMEEVETRVVPVVLNNGAVFDQNKGTLKEKKISYKFVKQAFMKAYIAAWRTFADATLVSPIQTTGVTLTNRSGYDSWILNEANSKGVNYTKVSKIDVGRYETLVKNYWEAWTNADDPETFSPGNSDHYPATACVWYKKTHDPKVETSAEACWTAVKEYLGQGNSIEENPIDQLYRVTLDGVEIRIYSTSNARLGTIEVWYNNGANGTKDNVQKNIAIKMLGYGLPTFEEAWEKLKGEISGASQTLAPTQTESVSIAPVFLIIEEINRGNCAQIFGDLFQLLDRKEGFSQYPIHADEDVRKCLRSEHSDEDPSFGIKGLEFSPEQASYINSVLDCEDDVAEKIAKGEVLVLPPNLYIWATMNTSDQSLFPIDSAFKRRWEWKYVKIKNHPEENYQIKLSDTDKRDWWEFVKQVNRIIASMTSSADKQLGYFFCKADGEGVISADKFVSKVMFYLWNDVFKDYGFEDASLFRYADATDPTKTHELTFPDFYDEEGEKVNIERVADFIDKVMVWDDNQKQG